MSNRMTIPEMINGSVSYQGLFQWNYKYCESSPPQGLSEARQGRWMITEFSLISDPPRGRPFGSGGVHPFIE